MRHLAFKSTITCALVMLLAWPFQAIAFEESEDTVLQELIPAFDHLLTFVDFDSQSQLNTKQVGTLLDFVAGPKPVEQTYTLGPRNNGSSTYYEFTINRSLKEVLDLIYNPNIPSYVTTPTSIRLEHWLKIDGNRQTFPMLSDALGDLPKPTIVKGIEFVENTPDVTSGAYYAYQLDRALILMQHQGQPVLLSVSNQKDKSNVGKKGLVLGSDEQWDYLYTGEEGLTKKGLTWADSYMYNSSSIMVYYQTKGPVPQVRCGTFKWLKAGWAGINLVQPAHIRKGIERYAQPLKEILESPALNDVGTLTRTFDQIKALSTEALREKSRLYFEHLVRRYKEDNTLTRKWLTELFKDETYIQKMSREEMQAIVGVEYIKYLLGKEQPFDVSCFQPSKTTAKRPG
jgi:hypothetical protein